MLDWLDLREGQSVLDVGAGAGDWLRAAAILVGKNGRAVGVDASQSMVDQARIRATADGSWAEYWQDDAQRLQFSDNTFDAVRAERVLIHLQRPEQAMREMMRVVRPGGRVVASDPDWGLRSIDHPDHDVTRRVFEHWCASFASGGAVARQLPRLFRESGLIDVEVQASASQVTDYALSDGLFGYRGVVDRACAGGAVTTAERDRWLEGLELIASGGHFASIGVVVTVRRQKPHV